MSSRRASSGRGLWSVLVLMMLHAGASWAPPSIMGACRAGVAAGPRACSLAAHASDTTAGRPGMRRRAGHRTATAALAMKRSELGAALESWRTSLVTAAAVGLMVVGGWTVTAPPAGAAMDGAAIGKCVLSSCQAELAQCITNPKCAANLICIQGCTGKSDESACQIRCGDQFENNVVGKFNACAVSQKKCVPRRQDDNSYPIPPKDALVEKFDTATFEGRWYISAGLNDLFDTFPCQVHFFTSPGPGTFYGKLNWRIVEPDGEFFTRNAVQRFVQDPKQPAVLYNHDNEYLHYQDDWYVLDTKPDEFVLIYYRGTNDAWDGYGGAVVYTRTPSLNPELIPRIEASLARANLNWADFKLTDNSCKAQDRDVRQLQAKYAIKLGEEALQQELTALRGFSSELASEQKEVSSEASSAIQKLDLLLEEYQGVAQFDLLELEDEVQTDVKGLLNNLGIKFGR